MLRGEFRLDAGPGGPGGNDMDFGFSIPHRGPLANAADQKRLARTGEQLGYAALTVSDHIVIPRDIGSIYPYSETGDFPGSRSGEALEMIALLAFLCGVTEKARLITSVMVLPHRNPVLAAKQLATADLLSGGRITVGCGVGWMREEFEAVGLPPFDERGRVADEYLRVFKAVWTGDPASFAGDYANFSNVSTLPHPVQKPHPPLWIGGESAPALRRVVALGDAWYPIGNNPRAMLDSLERYRARRDLLFRIAGEARRDPSTIGLAYSAPWHFEQAADDVEGGRRFLTGSAGERAADLRALGELGVGCVFLNFAARTVERTEERLSRFADEVMPLVS